MISFVPKRLTLRSCLLLLGLLLTAAATAWPRPSAAQSFDQLTRPIASITEASLIRTMLDELLILLPDTVEVTRVEVVDLTANGYGPDDVLIVYPSLETYLLRDDVPASVQSIMKRWELEADYRLDASLAESERVVEEAHRQQSATDALAGEVIAVVDRYYHAPNIDLRLSRESSGLRLEMWNFDPDAMAYVPEPLGIDCPPQAPALPQSASLPATEQQFRFGQARYVLSFRDPGECVVTVLKGGEVHTRPCS